MKREKRIAGWAEIPGKFVWINVVRNIFASCDQGAGLAGKCGLEFVFGVERGWMGELSVWWRGARCRIRPF